MSLEFLNVVLMEREVFNGCGVDESDCTERDNFLRKYERILNGETEDRTQLKINCALRKTLIGLQ